LIVVVFLAHMHVIDFEASDLGEIGFIFGNWDVGPDFGLVRIVFAGRKEGKSEENTEKEEGIFVEHCDIVMLFIKQTLIYKNKARIKIVK